MSPDLEEIKEIIENGKLVTSPNGLTVQEHIDALQAKYDNDVKLSKSIYENPNFEYEKSFELLKASRDRVETRNEPEFNFDYARLKEHAESPTVFMPKDLSREEKMEWLMRYDSMNDIIGKLNNDPCCTQEWLLERLRDKFKESKNE